jgi:hypothetical protein
MCFTSSVYHGEERNYFSETMSKEWMYDIAIMFHFVFPFQIRSGNGSRITTGHAQSIYIINNHQQSLVVQCLCISYTPY